MLTEYNNLPCYMIGKSSTGKPQFVVKDKVKGPRGGTKNKIVAYVETDPKSCIRRVEIALEEIGALSATTWVTFNF